ncbi:uncharacterized protein BX664DRAFT_254586 [Halteromyces radiatus]|uniref:uncharacterized protein n=1 Tax=Halteromyces radiatus TaxID=101107 RepID=UPI00221F9D53|nr:uncharacterized protein BX664DRAFT_254586 [Halteromyces radiatus]KAI8098883.1 hypothetical protein BX664DRAFT_254586 [Halteromyces radiatus]
MYHHFFFIIIYLAPTPSSSSHLPNKGYNRTDEIKRSRSFAYGSQSPTSSTTPTTTPVATPTITSTTTTLAPSIYPALLSRIAYEFQHNMILADRFKNGIEYKNCFTGQEAVDQLSRIIATNDRFLALVVGRALGVQRFFHDVSYENRLVDSAEELYQLEETNFINKLSSGTSSKNNNKTNNNEDHMVCDSPTTTLSPGATTESNSSVSDLYVHHPGDNDFTRLNQHTVAFPNGIITDLTYCYSPTCYGNSPCYSYSCPKRQSMKRHTMTGHFNQLLRPQDHPLWADLVSEKEYDIISSTERKRQEGIYELIYTESNYVKDLEYLEEMWIRPLTETEIIPESRRAIFLDSVFSNLMSIYAINVRLLTALLTRQKERLVVHAIGDIMLDFVVDFEPYIKYGARQHEAKYALEQERYNNPHFDWFINDTERHPASHKLELNGYLTKPTTRMGKYLLLLHEILKRTPNNHPDFDNIPKAIAIIKQFLTRVNAQAGATKNRFDLDRMHEYLTFKNKADAMDLGLLKDNRVIIKQGTLRKTPNNDSTEYQVILLDHYLVVAKVKVGRGGTLKYVVQRRPMALDLLTVFVPKEIKEYTSSNVKPASITMTPTTTIIHDRERKVGYPIVFDYLGRRSDTDVLILYATSDATRKPWVDKITKQQEDRQQRNKPVFELVSAVEPGHFDLSIRINHIITFNNGQQYLLATDDGVYVGHTSGKKKPHKVLGLPKVTQIQVVEQAQILLVLSDRTLYEYGLDVVNGKPELQPLGKRVQSHVPFFYVGQSLERTLVCVPRVSSLKSTITTLEPINNNGLVSNDSTTLSSLPSLHLRLKRLKDFYVPCDIWAIELSPSKMLITSPRGMIMVDMKTDKPQQLLDPDDKRLTFVTDREREESSQIRQPLKHIAIFRTPRGDHFVCYDEYGFYIDGKGNRLYPNFLVEWEGNPEAFACQYPYVIAFEPSFIEVRHIITGELEQIIRGSHIRCLNNGHKTEKPLIFGVMSDGQQSSIFELRMTSSFKKRHQSPSAPHRNDPALSTMSTSSAIPV